MDNTNAQGTALDTINPTGQDVSLADGSTITVKPIKLGQLPRFVKAIRPAFGALVALAPATSSPGDAGGQGAEPGTDLDPVQLLGAYAEHGESINEALAIATGQPVTRIAGLELDDGLALLRSLWEVNRDFFVHRVLPLLNRPQ